MLADQVDAARREAEPRFAAGELQKPFPQAVLQNKAESAVITSNRFAGPTAIANPANAALQAGLNVEKKPAP